MVTASASTMFGFSNRSLATIRSLISEVSDNRTGQSEATGYIELYNKLVYSVDVSGYQVRVGVGDGMGNFTPTGYVYTIPEGTIIEGLDFLLIGGGANYADFTAAWGITEPINYLAGDTQLGLTSGAAYDLYNPFTRAGSLDDTPNVGAGENIVHLNQEEGWTAPGSSDAGTPGEFVEEQTLPVTFATLHGTAHPTAENVLLKWTTQSESDMQGYHIYRSETSEIAEGRSPYHEHHRGKQQLAGIQLRVRRQRYRIRHHVLLLDRKLREQRILRLPTDRSARPSSRDRKFRRPVYDVTELQGNWPNPFNPETEINFSIKGTDGDMMKRVSGDL